MAILLDSNTKVTKITPKTDFWTKTDPNSAKTTEKRKQDGPDTVIINDDAKATTIDYSKSLFDNDLFGSSLNKNTIIGGLKADLIVGGSKNDSLSGGEGSDTILGGADDDKIVGGLGDDVLSGDVSETLDLVDPLNSEYTTASSGNDTLTGGKGYDLFSVNADIDTVTDLGLEGDAISVSEGATVNATVVTNWTADQTTINDGTANIFTKNFTVDLSDASGLNGFTIHAEKSSKATSLTGSSNVDSILGGSGNDTINAGDDDDIIRGNKGNDSIEGGAGNDIIYGGAGKNLLIGGDDSDVFVYAKGDGTTTIISDFLTEVDELHISSAAFKGLNSNVVLEVVNNPNYIKGQIATDVDTNFIYNSFTGKLYFDADGSATKSKPVLIETLGTGAEHPALTGSDISIIA